MEGISTFNQSRLQLIVLVVAFVLFVVSIMLGVLSGISYGKSLATYHGVDTINQALQYYKKDQGVYPTPTQFSDDQILRLLYIDTMPVPADVTGSCSNYKDFQYTQTTRNDFTLQFCLLQAVNGWAAGVNHLSNPAN